MFDNDARTMQRIAPLMQRVLIVDPAPASVRLLTDLLRDISNCQVWTAPDVRKGFELAERVNPHIIFVEQNASVDGAAFTHRLRRSNLACRKAPVIMVTSEATAAIILGARDSGVHEFLRKPFTIKDLMRRLEAVTLRSRDWVEAVNYVGPDRRRFNSGDYTGPLKRNVDQAETPEMARIVQALKILRSAIGAIDTDPQQALRSMQAQAQELQAAARAIADIELGLAALALQKKLLAAKDAKISKQDLQMHLAELWGFLPAGSDGAAAA
ncbi:MAG TPA: response regulator [Caulobacteraceae bacterium]|nr:response regulator [Caulobacteraceae bacterium]